MPKHLCRGCDAGYPVNEDGIHTHGLALLCKCDNFKHQEGFKVKRLMHSSSNHYEGIPCITTEGDFVLCEFRGFEGHKHAEIVCNVLNAAHAANKDLQGIS